MDFIVHHAPVIGLIFFLVFFAGVLVYVGRSSQKAKIESYANIPFEEDENV